MAKSVILSVVVAAFLQNTKIQIMNNILPSAAKIHSQGYTGCDFNFCSLATCGLFL